MEYLDRFIFEKVILRLKPNKVVVLLGPRRIGKTIFLNNLIKNVNEPFLLLNGEDSTFRMERGIPNCQL